MRISDVKSDAWTMGNTRLSLVSTCMSAQRGRKEDCYQIGLVHSIHYHPSPSMALRVLGSHIMYSSMISSNPSSDISQSPKTGLYI